MHGAYGGVETAVAAQSVPSACTARACVAFATTTKLHWPSLSRAVLCAAPPPFVDTHRLLWRVPAGAVVFCQARHHHLRVAFGAQRAALQQGLAVVDTPGRMGGRRGREASGGGGVEAHGCTCWCVGCDDMLGRAPQGRDRNTLPAATPSQHLLLSAQQPPPYTHMHTHAQPTPTPPP